MKKRSPEHCKHLSESLKGRTISPETRLKLSKALKGKPFTKEHGENQMKAAFSPEAKAKRATSVKALFQNEEYRERRLKILEQSRNRPEVKEKRSKSLKEYYSHPENRQRMSEICKQVPHDDEWNRKVSESLKGRIFTEEHRCNIGKTNCGEKNYGWLGGVSFLPYSYKFTKHLKESIKARDNYKCRLCGIEAKLFIHHIDYDKFNCQPENLISLCLPCHVKTSYNRDCWREYLIYKNREYTI